MSGMRWVVPAVAAALLAAGCGGGGGGESGKSARQILGDAKRAAKAAQSVHVTGTVDASRQQVTLDLTLTNAGGARGSITEGGSVLRFVEVGGNLYYGGLRGIPKGSYVQASGQSPQATQITSFAEKSLFVGQLFSGDGTPTKAGTKSVNGQGAVVLRGSRDRLYVADDASHPYPLRIENLAGRGGLDFTEWGATVTITPPANVLRQAPQG